MNILFLTMVDIKSIKERGIYQDLLREFIKNDHIVYITSPSERRNKKKTTIIEQQSCKILKVRTFNLQKVNIIEKGVSTILIEQQFKMAIKKHFSNIRFDLIMYSTPPITLAGVVEYIKKRDAAKTYLLLKDIFPQNAVDIGMMKKNGLIHKYFRLRERQFYQLSDYIGCMSQANVDYVLKHNPYVEKSKVHISPNSMDPVEISCTKKAKETIRREYDIPTESMVFIYGGNLGKPQDIPFVIECLKQNQDKEGRYFVICGTGTDYIKLKNYITEYNPSNVKLINGLPKVEYGDLIRTCNVGLIFLDKRFTIPNFPSRILSYMESSMPVIACTDKNTDVGKVIVDGDFGWWCESTDIRNFTDIVDNINLEDVYTKGKNARNYLEENYTVEKSYNIIMGKLGII